MATINKPPTIPDVRFGRFMGDTYRGQGFLFVTSRDKGRPGQYQLFAEWNAKISKPPTRSEILAAYATWEPTFTRSRRWQHKSKIRTYADDEMHKALGYEYVISGPQLAAFEEKERQADLVIGGSLNPLDYPLISNRATALSRSVAQEAADVKARSNIYRFALAEIQMAKDNASAAVDLADDDSFLDVDYESIVQTAIDAIIAQLP